MAQPLERIAEQYEIVAKLKGGGMGEIYKVRHLLLDELRVAKVLRPQYEDDERHVARFAQEARAAIQLRHPNVVQIFDFTLAESGTGVMVMELIRGADLGQLISHRLRPSVALGLEIARQGLRALGYLHRHGFVHRDVSPDNLMLTADVEGRPLVKLIDLGIAKHLDSHQDLTTSGIFVGKFRYASPEHFGSRGEDGIETRSDLYTFGLVLYELLTGCFPIVGDTTTQLIAGHLYQPPRDFAETDPEGRLPERLRRALLRTLAKDPEERFATARELVDELEAMRGKVAGEEEMGEEARRLLAEAEAAQVKRRGEPSPPPVDEGGTSEEEGGTPSGIESFERLLDAAREHSLGEDFETAGKLLEQAREVAGDDPERRRRVGAAGDEIDRRERQRGEVAEVVEKVRGLLSEGRLMEADREIFQAGERYGMPRSLGEVREQLDELYQQEREATVRDLLAQAAERASQGDLERALDVIHKARAALPAESALQEELRARQEEYRRRIAEEQRARLVAAAEPRIEGHLDAGELAAARDALEAAEAEVGSSAPFEELRRRIDRAIHKRLHRLVKEAGVALRDGCLEEASEPLRSAVELQPDDPWIRARLREAEERESRFRELLGQAEESREQRDFLKARLLVAEALELRPDDDGAREMAAELDRQRLEPVLEPPPPGTEDRLEEIQELRREGRLLTAWRAVRSTIEELGEIEPFLTLRQQIAEELLEGEESG
jgi:serine/threonine-protein kinase